MAEENLGPNRMYLNPEMETMPIEELRTLQLTKLQKQLSALKVVLAHGNVQRSLPPSSLFVNGKRHDFQNDCSFVVAALAHGAVDWRIIVCLDIGICCGCCATK